MAQVTMGHHLMSMQCGLRALGHLSLVFGLLASGALSLAVATDFWLFTTEQMNPSFSTTTLMPTMMPSMTLVPPSGGDDENDEVEEEEEEYSEPKMTVDNSDGENEANMTSLSGEDDDQVSDDMLVNDLFELAPGESMPLIVVKVHSGLWRTCLYWDDEEAEELQLHPQCWNIGYLQDNDRHDGADTTNSILRAIRKSSPVIVGSLLVMVTALTFSIIGNSKRDVRTLIAAILYVCSALSLAVGVIFYISAVNDEVSHRKKTQSSTDGFSYRYGWAFFFAGSSFMCSMVAAVNNISLYLRRGLEQTDDCSDSGSSLRRTTDIATTSVGLTTGRTLDHTPSEQYHLHHVNITTPV